MKKKKLKPLLPSLREKKRYIAFEVISKDKADYSIIEKSILDSAKEYIGTLNLGKAGLMFLKNKYNKEKQTGIIKVNNKYLDHLRVSLALVNNQAMIIRSLGASGILKKLDKFI